MTSESLSPAATQTFSPEPRVASPKERHLGSGQFIRLGSLFALLLVFIYFSCMAPGFSALSNLANIVEQSATLALLAFGMTAVIIGGGGDVIRGGIDLSVGANLGLCIAIYAVSEAAGYSDVTAFLLTLAAGLAVGALNALAVVGLGVLPLLATLAVMNICAGLELVLTQNMVISSASPLLAWITAADWLGLSVTSWSFIIIGAVMLLLVHRTPWGLRLQAVGGHREAARAAGLRVPAYRAASYLGAGLLAALAAILQAARLSGSSPGSGDILLSVVLTSLMSVVFSRRLLPSIGGTILSVLFIGCLINGFQLLNVSSYWVNGVQGLLILGIVALRSLSDRPGVA
ncbi:MAG TPA: ABC transporter permease [Acidisoma sp.]|uniref:ABC transporter permease n=1 Tax=Acidisoma sp. TaxID=1872115 RepID=UPI002B68D267|nr:ABC transporter permease [Acidisoma sp.]HTI03481.1 ABC transporter permease [Acidisoma sp.]